MVVLLAVFLPVAVSRAIRDSGSDFPEFYTAAQHLVQHGTRAPDSKLYRYLPSSDAAFVVFLCLPLPAAAGLWYLLNCATWFALLRTIRRYLLPDADDLTARQATLCAGLLALPLALDGFCLGAFHVLMVWLMVAGLARIGRGKWGLGGCMLGMAVWVKLLPLLAVGYLLLKRKWRPAVTAVAVALLIDIVLSVSAYGVPGAWRAHRDWWYGGALGATSRQLTAHHGVNEDRLTNQSLTVVLRRVLTTSGVKFHRARRRVVLADFSAGQLTAVFAAVSAALGLAFLYLLRRPGTALTPPDWAAEIALVALGTIWFSPVMWGYHPTAATPALAIIVWQRRYQWPAWTMAALWLMSLALMGVDLARALGGMLWMTVLVGAALIWVTRLGGRSGVRQPVGLLGHGQ